MGGRGETRSTVPSPRNARTRAAYGGASGAVNTAVSARVLIVPWIARFSTRKQGPEVSHWSFLSPICHPVCHRD